jgi:hypothetical protein
MSKSPPPATSTAEPRPSSSRSEAAVDSPANAKGKSFHTQFAAAVRWLHIYVSLLSFTALLFFAVTGVTLNHPTWFGVESQRTTEQQGQLDKALLNLSLTQATSDEPDYSLQVDKLAVAEQLRAKHHLRGAVGEFRVDEIECLIVFKGPGYSADVIVNRTTGDYQLTETVLGTVAILNDLHKGRDTGAGWAWVIDISAIVMAFVSVTGLILIFYLKRRRLSGIITAVVGTILFAVLYVWLVP